MQRLLAEVGVEYQETRAFSNPIWKVCSLHLALLDCEKSSEKKEFHTQTDRTEKKVVCGSRKKEQKKRLVLVQKKRFCN